jgi:hypothetical protein
MPYRSKTDAPSGTGELVTFRRYLDPVQAQMDRARLSAEGIEAHVIEAASYNPMLSGAAGGTQLQVREGDLRRVEALLQDGPAEQPRDDGEEAGVVRCPRCELAYCFHERLRLEGSSAATALAFLAAPFMVLLPKRWHCHKCGHVWDDPKEGPAEMTKLDADDPRPVFRLRRRHAGMGVFLGVMTGFFAMLIAPSALPRDLAWLGFVGFCATTGLGYAIGRSWFYDLCSEPSCRAQLTPDREDCPRCKGALAGVIRSAEEHYAAAADFRRDLAALSKRDAPRKKKKKKAQGASSA